MNKKLIWFCMTAALVVGIRPAAAGPVVVRSTRLLPPYPDALGVAAPVAGVSGGELLVGGGANFPKEPPWEGGSKVWYDDLYALKPGATNWIHAGKMPHTIAYAVTLTTEKGIFVAGGSSEAGHHGHCFLLSWNGLTVETKPLPSLPKAIANACGAAIGSTIYLAGGEDRPGATTALRDFWCIDISEDVPVWRSLPPWDGPGRTLAAAGVQGGKFFLVGGVELSAGPDGKPVRRYLNDVHRWDPARGKWVRRADLPNPVAAAPSPLPVVDETRLLVVGGDDGSKYGFQPVKDHPGFPPRLLVYDAPGNRWMAAQELPACRVTVPAVEWEGATIIPSGEMRPGVRSPEVRSYQWEHE